MADSEGGQAAPLLSVDKVTKRFGGLTAVSAVTFTVRAGEIVGIIGPNGAGKTTLFNTVSGHLRSTEGVVRVNGHDVTGMPAHQRARHGLGRTFQIVHPIYSLTVLENVMVGAFAMYRNRRRAEHRAWEVLEKVELAHRATLSADALTLADRKRLEVARAIAGNTQLLMLDEVMAGLNPTESDRAIQIVKRLNSEGLAVLLIEHNLKVVRALAQHVLVLDHGVPIAEGTPKEVLDNPQVVEAYLGTKAVR
jgi:branched-chain amino acid transport system ATP-binding protein